MDTSDRRWHSFWRKVSLHERLCPASQRALSTFFTSVQVY